MSNVDYYYEFETREVDGFVIFDLNDRETRYFSDTSRSCRELRKQIDSISFGVIVNFTNVTGLTSLLLGQIAYSSVNLKKRGVFFGVCGLNEDIESIFRITQLDSLITIGRTVEETIQALREKKIEELRNRK